MVPGSASSGTIPSINLDPFLSGKDKDGIVRSWREACETIGFVVISGSSLPTALLDRTFDAAGQFFDQPLEVKKRAAPSVPGKQRGYAEFASRGLAKTLGQETPPDLKESFFLGPIDDHRTSFASIPAAADVYAPNILPQTPAGFADRLVETYRAFERLGSDLLRISALALNLEENWFADKVDKHFSVMTCHHYPPLAAEPRPGQLRAGAHTDFGALTILAMTDALGGLEVQTAGGTWTPVKIRPGDFVVNLGDMMARWTNDRWRSTLHRVANPPGISLVNSRRRSIGYFLHPNYDALIRCIPAKEGTASKPLYPDISAGEHIRMKIEQSAKAA